MDCDSKFLADKSARQHSLQRLRDRRRFGQTIDAPADGAMKMRMSGGFAMQRRHPLTADAHLERTSDVGPLAG